MVQMFILMEAIDFPVISLICQSILGLSEDKGQTVSRSSVIDEAILGEMFTDCLRIKFKNICGRESCLSLVYSQDLQINCFVYSIEKGQKVYSKGLILPYSSKYLLCCPFQFKKKQLFNWNLMALKLVICSCFFTFC